MIRFSFRRAVAAGAALLLSSVAASAELREALPGTTYEWQCTGDWKTYREVIVEADSEKLVKDAFVDGEPWSRTWRRSWLRGAALYYRRDFEKFGLRTVDYDWNKLRGFENMEVGWSVSDKATMRGEGRRGPWTDRFSFEIRHESQKQLSSPVYGEISVVKTVTKMSYQNGARYSCEALIFPDDAAQVEFDCRQTGGRTNLDFSCKLTDRY